MRDEDAEVAQQGKTLVTTPDDLSLIPETYTVEGDSHPCIALTFTRTAGQVCQHT